MDKKILLAVSQILTALQETGAHKATKYISSRLVVRACRRAFGGKIDKRGNFEAVLTIGRPNVRQRDFIRRCNARRESFPIKEVLLDFTK